MSDEGGFRKHIGQIRAAKQPTRLDLGEAWMWCSECGAKLYSFSGTEDKDQKCPDRTKCGGGVDDE